MENTFELKPDEIKKGMRVALAKGIPDVIKAGQYTVIAIQLPYVVLGWPKIPECRWLVDTRQAELTELSPEIVEALG